MKTTFVKNGAFRGRRLVLLETPVDPQQKDQLKTLPEADWNPKLNPSTLPYSDSVIADLLTLPNGKGKKERTISNSEKTIEILRANYQFEKFDKFQWSGQSDATHFFDHETDSLFIHSLLGHVSSKTTVTIAFENTHIGQKSLPKIKSPFDNL